MGTASKYDENARGTIILFFIVENDGMPSLYMLYTTQQYAVLHLWKMGEEAIKR